MNGGYVMINCKGLDLTKGTTEQTISGLYLDVKNAMESGKPMIAYNCIWGNDKNITPINVFAIDFDSYVIVTTSTLQVIITPLDVITINNLVA